MEESNLVYLLASRDWQIALKFEGFKEAFVEDMDLEVWVHTWCLKKSLDSLESSVLWPLCIVEALWT